MKIVIKYFSLIIFLAGLVDQGFAQWQTQNFTLNQGWNSIYTHVDAKHTAIEALVNEDIQEVWMWTPKLSTLQYVQSVDQPAASSSRWLSWIKSKPAGSRGDLNRIIGNSAYLIKSSKAMTWKIQGKPVPPRYQWTSTGLNFIGFSTPVLNPPIFSSFLNPVNGFGTRSQIFSYEGGGLSEPTPFELFTRNTSTVKRGQAYWVRAEGYNRYYGPFDLELQDWSGVEFGEGLSSFKITLKNTTVNELTVSMQLLDSETGPNTEGIPTVTGTPPIIVRGDYHVPFLTHEYSSLNNNTQSWTLKPIGQSGSIVEIWLGVHWAELSGSAGDLFAGILRFKDNSGHLQTDLPLSVTKPSTTGLWVGEATVDQVRHSMHVLETSIINGQAKAAVAGTTSDPITVSWLKRESVAIRPIGEDGEDYIALDSTYHLIKNQSYDNVSVGDSLSFPTEDENGNLLSTAPADYWQARPYHEAFVKGWYFIKASGVVVPTGNKNSIEMKFVKISRPSFLSGVTVVHDTGKGQGDSQGGSSGKERTEQWHFVRDKSYTGVSIGDTLLPPSNDENDNPITVPLSSYWSLLSGTKQADGTPTWDETDGDNGKQYKANVAGDITLSWMKYSYEHDAEYKTVTVDGQPTLFRYDYKTITKTFSKTVIPQRFAESDIFTSDMASGVWNIVDPPTQPPFNWEGTNSETDSGSYVVSQTDTSWGAVDKPMKLRLIVHNNDSTTSSANLLQRIYIGNDKNNNSQLLSTGVELLPDDTPEVRRISSVHLPWSENNAPLPLSGSFSKGGTLTTTVIVDYDDQASNPFLHTYHPDHDNLDSRFENKLPQGQESYEIKRDIILYLNGSLPGFSGLSQTSSRITGEYEEIITLSGKEELSGTEKRQYGMKGRVAFSRITPEPILIK